MLCCLAIIHYLQHFHKSTEGGEQGGEGKSSCMLSKMLVLAPVLVHETNLANQIFIVRFGEEGGGKSILCTHVKMLMIPY